MSRCPSDPRELLWPVRPGKKWVAQVNRAETEAELKAVRRSVACGTAFG